MTSWPCLSFHYSQAQSNSRLTGDQDVLGSIPAGFGNILSWDLIMKYFQAILSLLLIQEGHLSFRQKNVHKDWLTA